MHFLYGSRHDLPGEVGIPLPGGGARACPPALGAAQRRLTEIMQTDPG
jgi:hypothetical protein